MAWGSAPLGPGGDDRVEARAAGPAPAHVLLERDRDVALGAALEPLADDAPQRGVGHLGRRGDAGDLLGVLDPAQPLDHPRDADERGSVAELLAQPVVLLDGHVLVFEADAQGPRWPGGLDQVDRRLEQVERDRVTLKAGVDLGRSLLDVAKVGEEVAALRPRPGRGRLSPCSRSDSARW